MKSHNDMRPKRWSAKRKLEVALRLLRGKPIDDVSRDEGVEIYRLEEWKHEAMSSIEEGFKIRGSSLLSGDLARAKQQIGNLSMEVELLKERVKKKGSFFCIMSFESWPHGITIKSKDM